MTFQIVALDPRPFRPLFSLDQTALAQRRARWVTADADPGFPCRNSLQDAPVGHRVLLVHYTHMPADSPFHASHAIYLDPEAGQAQPSPGEVPALFHARQISWRGFDTRGLMRDAGLCRGDELAQTLPERLVDPDVEQIHLHFAAPGCFAARVVRA